MLRRIETQQPSNHGNGQVAQVVERSPEKAGVGGSTPSLATIIPKNLRVFTALLQPKVQPKIRPCTVSVSRCNLAPEQYFQELTLSFELRFLVGLHVELHGGPDIFVTQDALHRLRITFQLHQSRSQ